MKLASTHTVAENLLNGVLAQYGKSACDTPQMFETLLRQHGRSCPQEVDVLATALHHGVVYDLRKTPPAEPEALARVLSVSARMPPQLAEWAVQTWAAALAAAPQSVAATSRADAAARSSSTPLHTALILAGAAVVGSLAYLIWAP